MMNEENVDNVLLTLGFTLFSVILSICFICVYNSKYQNEGLQKTLESPMFCMGICLGFLFLCVATFEIIDHPDQNLKKEFEVESIEVADQIVK